MFAECSDERFHPQRGVVAQFREPSGAGVRVDSGIAAGSEVGVKFDPMLAKLICSAPSRDECIDRLDRALRDTVILGTKTNVSWLRRVVTHPAFREGLVSTRFLADHEETLRQPMPDVIPLVAAALAAAPHT